MATATMTLAALKKEVDAKHKALKGDPVQQTELLAELYELLKKYPKATSTEPASQEKSAAVKSTDATALPSSHFKYDKAKDNWKLLEDVQFTPPEPTTLAITGVVFLRDGESYVNGEEMVTRDRKEHKCNLGQSAAEWLLENPHLIPTDLRGKALVFTGTIWQSPRGDRDVVYLYWGGDRWVLGFHWLGGGWGGGSVLARLSGSTSA